MPRFPVEPLKLEVATYVSIINWIILLLLLLMIVVEGIIATIEVVVGCVAHFCSFAFGHYLLSHVTEKKILIII